MSADPKKKEIQFWEQKTTGKIWLNSDFNPTFLRLIYDQFENRVVDAYLDGKLSRRTPKLVSSIG